MDRHTQHNEATAPHSYALEQKQLNSNHRVHKITYTPPKRHQEDRILSSRAWSVGVDLRDSSAPSIQSAAQVRILKGREAHSPFLSSWGPV